MTNVLMGMMVRLVCPITTGVTIVLNNLPLIDNILSIQHSRVFGYFVRRGHSSHLFFPYNNTFFGIIGGHLFYHHTFTTRKG